MRLIFALLCAFGLCVPVALLMLMVAGRIYYGGHGLAGGFHFWHLWVAGVLFLISFVGGFRWGWDLKKPATRPAAVSEPQS